MHIPGHAIPPEHRLYNGHPVVDFLVAKEHVSETYLNLCRMIVAKLKGGYATFRTKPRHMRRWFLRCIVLEHARNRDVYRGAMKNAWPYD